MTHTQRAGRDASTARGAGTLMLKPDSGFTYLLGDPTDTQRSTTLANIHQAGTVLAAIASALPAAPPADAPGAVAAVHPVWGNKALEPPDIPAQANFIQPQAHAAQSPITPDDNPTIPAGYTYTLQFIAHDLVQTAVPFWAAVEANVSGRNLRPMGLQLDTLYGGGPAVCPIAYQPQGDDIDYRTLLRLGQPSPLPISTAPGAAHPPACPYRDLARVNVIDRSLGGPFNSVNLDRAYATLIADPRNDDNVILAQLTVLFAQAHNAIASALTAKLPDTTLPETIFGAARTALLHAYYNIILQDVLKKILYEPIYDAVKDRSATSAEWLWDGSGTPLEFSHGAFRVGHAMVRNGYTLFPAQTDPLLITDSVDGNHSFCDLRNPLPSDWVLQWSFFFDRLGRVPNYSRRIGPTSSRLDHEALFPNRAINGQDGVTLRDLLSSTLARMWSVDAMIAKISNVRSTLIPASWPLRDRTARTEKIKDWYTNKLMADPRLSDATRASLGASQQQVCADPPLPLFILLEAALDPNVSGKCLGVLGSIIVGEVIGRRVKQEMKRLQPELDQSVPSLTTAGLWAEIDAISSMPGLVMFVNKYGAVNGVGVRPFL